MENEEQQFSARLNILVCGRAGSGKSTLINKILMKKDVEKVQDNLLQNM